MERGLRTLIVFFCALVIMVLIVSGCANEYDLCLERERAEYRQKNPQASVAQVLSRQRDFEVMCSRYRT